jgi:outer membrane protein TolC
MVYRHLCLPSRRLVALAPAILATATAPAWALSQQQPKSQPDLSKPLTLSQCISIALKSQPSLAIARSRQDASEARVTSAMSDYFPHVGPKVQYSFDRSRSDMDGGAVTVRSESTVSSLTVRQLLYDTGRREANVASARAGAAASRYGLADTRLGVILDVTSGYYEVLRSRELVRVQVTNAERARTTLESVRAAVEAQTVRKIDTLQADADYANAMVQVSIAKNDARLAEITLRKSMGISTPVAVVLAETPTPAPSAEPDARTAASYIDAALRERPDLKELDAGIESSRQSTRLAKISSGVVLEANASASYWLNPDGGDSQSVIAAVTYPLFDAGLARSQVRSATAAEEQARQQLELQRQAVQLEVEQAYLLKEEARARSAAAEAATASAKANFEAASESYTNGAGTVVDVITARSQLVTAETNAVQAIYDFHVAEARLARATGTADKVAAGGNG